MRYSLADYLVTIGDIDSAFGQDPITIGGEGSYTDTISVVRTDNAYETIGDATGSWVHKKSLSSVGTVTMTLNQVADKIAKLRQLFNVYYQQDILNGFTVTIVDSEQHTVAKCIDCFVQNIPEQSFSSDPATQPWVITCGKVIFDPE